MNGKENTNDSLVGEDAYLVYSYVDQQSVLQELQCPICLEPFVEAIELSDCQHSFCRRCIEQLKTNQCPSCRAEFHPSSVRSANPIIKRLTDGLAVYCTHKDEGCSWQGVRERLKPHLKQDCDYVVSACKYKHRGCPFVGSHKQLEIHLSGEGGGSSNDHTGEEEEEGGGRRFGSTVARCRFNLMEPYTTQLEDKILRLEEEAKELRALIQSCDVAHHQSPPSASSSSAFALPPPSPFSSSSPSSSFSSVFHPSSSSFSFGSTPASFSFSSPSSSHFSFSSPTFSSSSSPFSSSSSPFSSSPSLFSSSPSSVSSGGDGGGGYTFNSPPPPGSEPLFGQPSPPPLSVFNSSWSPPPPPQLPLPGSWEVYNHATRTVEWFHSISAADPHLSFEERRWATKQGW